MTALVFVAIGWLLVGAAVPATGVRDVRERGEASRVTAALLWPWHTLNYALVIVAAAEGLWRIDVSATPAVIVGGLLIPASLPCDTRRSDAAKEPRPCAGDGRAQLRLADAPELGSSSPPTETWTPTQETKSGKAVNLGS